MPDVFPQDTPIVRASIIDLTPAQQNELIDKMRERRMRLFSLYQEAEKAKAQLKHDKDLSRYEKVLTMFQKKLDTVDNGLDALSKYAAELQVLQLALGD